MGSQSYSITPKVSTPKDESKEHCPLSSQSNLRVQITGSIFLLRFQTRVRPWESKYYTGQTMAAKTTTLSIPNFKTLFHFFFVLPYKNISKYLLKVENLCGMDFVSEFPKLSFTKTIQDFIIANVPKHPTGLPQVLNNNCSMSMPVQV